MSSLAKLNDLDDFILRWNNKFPFDYWWRKKYDVAFNSKRHREMDPIDMFFDYREEELLKRKLNEQNESKKRASRYRDTGEFLRKKEKYVDEKEMSQQEINDDFESLEI